MNPMWITAAAAVLFGSATTLFAYLAYNFTREKFMLDLFDRRWEYFLELWNASGRTLTIGDEPPRYGGGGLFPRGQVYTAAIQEPESQWQSERNAIVQCIGGTGRLRAKALFGPEVLVHLDAARKILQQKKDQSDPDELKRTRREFLLMTGRLSDSFAPYLYFGHHRHFDSAWRRLRQDLLGPRSPRKG